MNSERELINYAKLKIDQHEGLDPAELVRTANNMELNWDALKSMVKSPEAEIVRMDLHKNGFISILNPLSNKSLTNGNIHYQYINQAAENNKKVQTILKRPSKQDLLIYTSNMKVELTSLIKQKHFTTHAKI